MRVVACCIAEGRKRVPEAATVPAFGEDFSLDTLDTLGNWAGYDRDNDGDGTLDLEQLCEHNKANEIDGSDRDCNPGRKLQQRGRLGPILSAR